MMRRSPFTVDPLTVEIYYGGAWHDITPDVGGIRDGGQITIERTVGGVGECRLTLANPTGEYSPRNPRSSLYGLIGRGTPMRVKTAHAGTTAANQTRFVGEIIEWPQEWTPKGSIESYAPVVAAGILRRLGQGASPLPSPLRRGIDALPGKVAYWPLEDGTRATVAQAVTPNTQTGRIFGAGRLGGYDTLDASLPLPTLQTGRITLGVPPYSNASPNTAQVRWQMFVPAGTPNGATLVRVYCGGTLGYVAIKYDSGDAVTIEGVRDDGTSAGVGAGWLSGAITGQHLRMSLEMTQSGTGISVTLGIIRPGDLVAGFVSGSFSAATIGDITVVDFNPLAAALGDTGIGHVTVEPAISSLFAVTATVLAGHAGEPADARIARLCAENGVPIVVTGTGGSQRMGPQGADTLLDLLDEAAAVGAGHLLERRDTSGLRYRQVQDLYSQTPALAITHTDNLLRPFRPIEDDAALRNEVTVTRDGGTSVTITDTTGPLGTDEIGVYDQAVTLSLAADSQVADHASWLVHLGTVDEARWPAIGLDLAHPTFLASTALTDGALAVDLGDQVTVTNLPDWLPPYPVRAIVTGVTETITSHSHQITWEATPASPYRVGAYDAAGDRWSGTGTVTAEALDATETGIDVTLPADVAWGHDTGDYQIVIGGEVMTVTAVSTPVGAAQTLTVTRSGNGVAKTHTAGAPVALADPCYYGLRRT